MSSLPLKLADLSLTEPSSSNFLQHPCHPHPLILFEKREEEEEGNDIICSACRDDPVSDDGPIYRCSSTTSGCEEFLLHKSCAELPMKIVSTVHPKHLLHLFRPSPNIKSKCDLCQERIVGFRYRCRLCDFDLHIKSKCASQLNFEPTQVHDDDHDHSFILLKPATFTCDTCGVNEESKMVSYLCTTCQFQVHPVERCSSSSYPLKLKQRLHSHQLILTYSFQLDFDYSHKSCKICNNKLNSVFCVYYCSTCLYIAHVSCATSEDLRDGQPVETTNEISHLGREREGEDQKATEQLLNHFSHPHSLILKHDEPESDQICDACIRPISLPFYTCPNNQCNFSLHKQCVELPATIRHPLHSHPLTLHPCSEVGFFLCRGCAVLCNGFAYTCDDCKTFSLDVRCSLFSDTLTHEGHQCTLDLQVSDETKCSACGFNCSAKFICEECNFYLDLRCASLPKETMHDCPKPNWGIRPIKLTYFSVEDESGEYYCDICEERRGQNHWFYYCEACDYSSHPQCILGKHLIKFGKTYELRRLPHPHPLTLVKKARRRPTSAACSVSCKDSPLLVCAECDIGIHFWGACMDFFKLQV